MNTLTVIILLIATLFSSDINSQIEFSPRALQKNLEKITGCSEFSKEELTIKKSDSYGNISGKFFRISCSGKSEYYVYVGRVKSCRASGCNIDNSSGEYEFFDYFSIYDSSLSIIMVNVYNYEATHGQEITAKGWLKQFIGYSAGKALEAGKNIDAISGATISVNGIVDDISEKSSILEASVNQ